MTDYTRIAPSQVLLNEIADWLMQEALAETEVETVAVACCERLRAAGIPLVRGYFAFSVLHPLHQGIGITWIRGHGSTTQGYPHVPGGISETYRQSPHYHMLERNLNSMRTPLDPDKPELEFPVLTELRDDGCTDYLAFVVGFGKGDEPGPRGIGYGMLGSWATDEPGGFTDSEISALLRIQGRLAVTCKLAVERRLMRNLAQTYLGRVTGDHVLHGQIRRGDGQSIEAAIWYSDLRGSSGLADTLPPEGYIDALNTYFDVVGGAILNNGGEILSFIGDAVLAIFPTDGTAQASRQACRHAVRAARSARKRLQAANTARGPDGLQALEYGTALHFGKVMYGNVGVPERLTFSVFGAAVNEVARLERLTKTLDCPVLASAVFKTKCGEPARDMGAHRLEGIVRDLHVYAPDDAPPPAPARKPARRPRRKPVATPSGPPARVLK